MKSRTSQPPTTPARARTQAALYTGERRLSTHETTPTPPGPGDVQIEVAYAGICGTDLHVLQGAMDDRVTKPAVLGHESSGRIAAVGDGVTEWTIGDPVTVMPLRWCGACAACQGGYPNVCQQLKVIGVDLPGSMQSRWSVPADVVVGLPAGLRLDHAALVEPTAVAVHDVRRSGLRSGEHVIVVGAGPIGLLIASVARAEQAQVVVLEIDPHRRSVAERMGLVTLDPRENDIVAYVDDWTGGAGVAVTFEVSGSPAGVRMATDVLAARGRMVVVAIHSHPQPVDLNRVFLRELTLLGARVYERHDFERAIDLVRTGVIQSSALISQIVPLSAAADAFSALESHSGVVKILIDCQAN